MLRQTSMYFRQYSIQLEQSRNWLFNTVKTNRSFWPVLLFQCNSATLFYHVHGKHFMTFIFYKKETCIHWMKIVTQIFLKLNSCIPPTNNLTQFCTIILLNTIVLLNISILQTVVMHCSCIRSQNIVNHRIFKYKRTWNIVWRSFCKYKPQSIRLHPMDWYYR